MRIILSCIAFIFIFIGCEAEEIVTLQESQEIESIIIGGSSSVAPILEILADNFEAENSSRKINFGPPGHTGAGIKGVNRAIYSLGALSRELKPAEKEYGLREFWFARDALVFATNPDVKLKGLSTDDIRAIYYGEIKNWKRLGGPDREIVVLDRYEDSSPKVLLYKQSLFEKKRSITDTAIVIENPNDMDIALINTRYSIGYTSLASIINESYDLNILELDGIKPSPENVNEGSYKLARPQGFVVKGEPEGLAREFTDFIFSVKGSDILRKKGYIPFQ